VFKIKKKCDAKDEAPEMEQKPRVALDFIIKCAVYTNGLCQRQDL
jgi:hypothetical protein